MSCAGPVRSAMGRRPRVSDRPSASSSASPSASPSGRVAERLAPETEEELENERDFLLRSLDDLDRELVAGNIDPDTYRVLHDDYTARASAVIQSIADGVQRDAPDGPRVSRSMRVLTIGGIIVFALFAGVLLAHTVGQRRSGGEITGDAQTGGGAATTTTSPTSDLAIAKATAAAQPKSYTAQIAYARALLAVGAAPAAIEQYVVAGRLDPTRAEPLAYAGYLTVIVSQNVTDANSHAQLIDAATNDLNRAVTTDPAYPDSYAFQGELLTQVEAKWCPGAAAFEHFLAIAPVDHPYHAQVETDLATAVAKGHCPGPDITPTTKP